MQTQTHQERPGKGPKIIAVVTFVFLFVFLFLYGFLSTYYNGSNLVFEESNITLQIFQTVFTMIGFGLLLTNSEYGKWTGMTMALFIVSYNYLFSPFMQELWTKIFLYFQDGTDLSGSVIAPTAQNFWDRNVSDKISTSYLSFRLSNVCSISFLVGLTGYGGRINAISLLPILTIYNFIFYLSFYLNVLLSFSTAVKDRSLYYLDDYGTYLIYLFGGVYGLLVSFITKKNHEQRSENIGSVLNSVIRLFGAFILFATFIFTRTDIIDFTGSGQNYKFNAGPMFILFSLITSVIGNTIVSVFLNQGKIQHNSIAIGVLSGGIISGALAGQMQNIGAACILGFVSGLISGVYMAKVHPKINSKAIVDEQGLIGPVLIIAFVGTFIVPACILNQYYIRSDTLKLYYLNEDYETEWRVARYQLVYFIITLVFALIAGAIGGILTKKTNSPETDFSHYKFFINDYGLYEAPAERAVNYDTQHQLRPDVI